MATDKHLPWWYSKDPTEHLFVMHRGSFYNLERDIVYQGLIHQLGKTGKYAWLKEQDIDISTIRVVGDYNSRYDTLEVAVLVDMPQAIRALYALTFTE